MIFAHVAPARSSSAAMGRRPKRRTELLHRGSLDNCHLCGRFNFLTIRDDPTIGTGRRVVSPLALKQPTVLALSGGGAYAAFGAGLLNGWSTRGTRPQFTIVTGASSGALIAPFAFLGTGQD